MQPLDETRTLTAIANPITIKGENGQSHKEKEDRHRENKLLAGRCREAPTKQMQAFYENQKIVPQN